MKIKFWYIIIVLAAALVISEYLKLDRPGRFLSAEENAVIEYYNTLVNANQNSTLYFINIETRISNDYRQSLSSGPREGILSNYRTAEDVKFFWENISGVKFIKMKVTDEPGGKKVSFKARVMVNDTLETYFELPNKKKNRIYLAGNRILNESNRIEKRVTATDTVIVSGYSNTYKQVLLREGFSWYDRLRPGVAGK